MKVYSMQLFNLINIISYANTVCLFVGFNYTFKFWSTLQVHIQYS